MMMLKYALPLLLMLGGGTAAAQVPAPAAPVTAATPVATGPTRGAPLERADVEAWLDGLMPTALAEGDLAGLVVVVVKDGQTLVQKGYGVSDVERGTPVSPEATLFRPGSISKLFTWTAVMQLVEEGKLDLDRDVNAYLDFKIPPYDGKPITLRNIMTHTPGFEESLRYLIASDPKRLVPVDKLVKQSLPARVFAPGTTPAYSNYATGLAGYIVARTSGLPFEAYVERRIFAPLGMNRSTFRQPLPANLQPLMSKGYALASANPMPYELVQPASAGALATTGADMAKFMIAHLADGRGLLRPETARMMHDTTLSLLPPLNSIALGFYEQSVNGRRVIAHGGNTDYFHSYLWLFPAEKVGLYISVNSTGTNDATNILRQALLRGFADRYFPTSRPSAGVDAATAREHARMMAGTYTSSRGSQTNVFRILDLLGQAKLGVDARGALLAPSVPGLGGQPREWIEIAPFVWRDADSGERLAAKVENGRVTRWSYDSVSPIMVFDRTPWYLDGAWLLPALIASLGVVLLTVLAWPAGAIARRRFGASTAAEAAQRRARRLANGFAVATLVAFGLWFTFFSIGMSDFPMLGGPLDWLLFLAQGLSLVGLVGLAAVAAWNLWLAWRRRSTIAAKLWGLLLFLAAAIILWVAIAFHLIGFGAHY